MRATVMMLSGVLLLAVFLAGGVPEAGAAPSSGPVGIRTISKQISGAGDEIPAVRTDCCIFEPVGLAPGQISFLADTTDAPAKRLRAALGLPRRGDRVRVIVASGMSTLNRNRPANMEMLPWAAGVAYPSSRTVAIHLSHFSAEDVRTTLEHELAHIYTAEKTGLRRLPRWFNEGVAMLLADERVIEHLETVFRAAPAGGVPELDEISDGFPAEGAQVTRAYATAHAFLRWATSPHGGTLAVRRILELVGSGAAFERAFETVLSGPPDVLEARWRQTLEMGLWLPFALHLSDILWFLSALLLLIGIWRFYRIRKRALERMQREEAAFRQAYAASRQKQQRRLEVIAGGRRVSDGDDGDDGEGGEGGSAPDGAGRPRFTVH
jgi:hypothetical protein